MADRLFVSVGSAGDIRTSVDGSFWTARASSTNPFFRHVKYGDGLWVAVAGDGMHTSTDAITWTHTTMLANAHRVAFLHGTWVVVTSSGDVSTSSDGFTWVDQVAVVPTLALEASDSEFIASGVGEIMRSTDGVSWQSVSGIGESINSVAYNQATGRWLAVTGNSDAVVYSDDGGLTWQSADPSWSTFFPTMKDVASGNGIFIASGTTSAGAPCVDTSADGLTWSNGTDGDFVSTSENDLNAITYADGIWVVIDTSGDSANSTDDGATWNQGGFAAENDVHGAILNAAPTVTLDAPNGGEVIDGITTLQATGTDPDADPLTYDYELTTDNATTWTRLITDGTSAEPYDFSAVAPSADCRVRVRAFDGVAYSAWDESDANFTIQHNFPPATPTLTSPNGGESIPDTWPVECVNNGDPDSDPLTFDYELTVDGGATWYPIITGGTPTEVYDFTNEPLSTTCRVRVRAFDGALYSSWDESDADFEIRDNFPPATPTPVAPVDNAELSRNEGITFEWSPFSDADGTAQTGYDVRFKNESDLEWTEINTALAGSTHHFESETFLLGAVEWQVRVYDEKGSPSAWSDSAFFIATGLIFEPDIVVEVAWSDNFAEPFPTWTDITDYVEAVSPKIGRTREIKEIEAGTCEFALDNTSGAFTPSKAESPFYPNVRPMRQIRVRAVDDRGISFNIFRGSIEKWPVQFDSLLSTVTVTATDWQEYFATLPLSTGFPEQTITDRVNAVLDQIGWPAGKRVVAVAESSLEPLTWTDNGPMALEVMQKPATDLLGLLYVNGNGDVVFEDRSVRLLAQERWQLSEGNGTAVERGLTFESDGDDILNAVTVENADRFTVTLTDDASIAEFGQRSESLGMTLSNDTEAQQIGERYLTLYAQPFLRVSGVALNPSASAEGRLWPVVLQLGISDLIRIADLPDNAPASDVLQFVESVAHDIVREGTRLKWTTTLDVSRANSFSVWQLGVPGASELGETTYIYL